MTPKKRLFGRDLENTAFSGERMFIWGLGIVMLIGMIAMAWIGIKGRVIPPQLQSAVMICIGVFAGRIEKR